MLSDQSIHGFLLLAPVFIVSLTLHELAHALAAYRLGDRTAKDMGRLTLNPIAHMDPLGSLILVLTYFGGSFLFGWAKPVPVEPAQPAHLAAGRHGARRRGRARDELRAGADLGRGPGAQRAHRRRLQIVAYSLEINVILGVFNLFPIPPLDGSRVIGGFMPRDVYAALGGARPVRHVRGLRAVLPLPASQTSRILESGFEQVAARDLGDRRRRTR